MSLQRVVSCTTAIHFTRPLSQACWRTCVLGTWPTQRRRYATIRKINWNQHAGNTETPGKSGVTQEPDSTPLTPFPGHDNGSFMREVRVHGNTLETQSSSRDFYPVSNYWLRDACTCASCRNQDTAQRQINVFNRSNLNCRIADIQTIDDGRAFQITFDDGHITTLSKATISNRRGNLTIRRRRGEVLFETWNAGIASSPPTVQYSDLETQGVSELLRKIRVHGFCFIDGTPPTPEATESLLTTIGPIRNTHYGGFYDFTADLSSKDTAYTSESLEPHTDNTYFTEPAGLQALHLLSHTEGSGGESSLVDGFNAAQSLYRVHEPSYKFLSKTGVWAHASGNEGISIQPEDSHPVIGHHPDGSIYQIRWNNADRAGLDCSDRFMNVWYQAASRFDKILNNPENQYWFQLTPGRVLIFDNWRVLHGRAAFTGKRRMCGGYINRDDFISKFRMTNMSEEEIRSSTVTG